MFPRSYFPGSYFAPAYFPSAVGAAVAGGGGGAVQVRYGHFRLRRASLTRRDAIAVAMQNRQES